MSIFRFLLRLKYHWLCFQEWLLFQQLKLETLRFIRFVSGFMKGKKCSLQEAAEYLSICEEDVHLCESIFSNRTSSLASAVDSYLRHQKSY